MRRHIPTVLAGSSLALFAAVAFAGEEGSPPLAVAAAGLAFGALLWMRELGAVTLAFALLGAAFAVTGGRLWPAEPLAATVVYALLAWRVPRLRPPAGWAPRGRIAWPWIGAYVAVTAAALVAWASFAAPDLSRFRAFLPDLPLPLLLLGAVVFPVPNALFEEALFRGLLHRSAERSRGGFWWAAAVQAVLFGVAHYRGFPSGLLGALMAGLWGLGLALLRRATGGLATPLVAHVAADATIFFILLVWLT